MKDSNLIQSHQFFEDKRWSLDHKQSQVHSISSTISNLLYLISFRKDTGTQIISASNLFLIKDFSKGKDYVTLAHLLGKHWIFCKSFSKPVEIKINLWKCLTEVYEVLREYQVGLLWMHAAVCIHGTGHLLPIIHDFRYWNLKNLYYRILSIYIFSIHNHNLNFDR